ncbi:DNA topology modulation protein [Maledivibacter halophilus]|uniref:Adenylate kinase n=1 Tax=Maledivibacter halophilus TaxID=36842 RepID=A0A1T5M285_9FIRM|nr:DNA topology modulation protein [Maledivibacter halophilus]SKC81959.1 Adenylate kinase [Maledivibacter halophilus]
MKKIMIVGSAGAGKSTLARRLNEIIGIKLFHLDKLFWKPGWECISREELKEKIGSIITLDSWIIDGNYSSTMEMRLKEADTIIFLDFPLWLCLSGVIKRRFMYEGKTRPDITEGCKEKLDWEFIKWILTFPYKKRKTIHKKIKQYSEERNVFVFKNRKEVEEFISMVRKNSNV